MFIRCINHDVRQTTTTVKCVKTPHITPHITLKTTNTRHARRNRHACQIGTASKSPLADFLHTVGNNHVLKPHAVSKRLLADGRDFAAIQLRRDRESPRWLRENLKDFTFPLFPIPINLALIRPHISVNNRRVGQKDPAERPYDHRQRQPFLHVRTFPNSQRIPNRYELRNQTHILPMKIQHDHKLNRTTSSHRSHVHVRPHVECRFTLIVLRKL